MTATQVVLPPTKLWIDGCWCDSRSGTTFETVNPSTEEVICQVAAAGVEDIDLAVRAARREFDGGSWSKLAGPDRRRLLVRFAELIDEHRQEIAELEALEVGKPVRDPLNVDLPVMIETLNYYAGWADKLLGSQVPVPDIFGRQRLCYTLRQPIGVVGAITPWNSPAMIMVWKLAAALAVGCTVVLKPPEDACLSTLRLAQLLEEAGLPSGTVSVVPGLGPQAGAALVRHEGVDKVSFTGSPEVGAEIASVAGSHFKRVTLELGGKSPQVIFPDADLERAGAALATSIFANQGEVCSARARLLVHQSRVDEVAEQLVAAAEAITVGDPFAPETTMGPLISAKHLARVLGYVDTGRAEGGELLTGGERAGSPGYFMEPTIFVGQQTMTIARDEIFGPVGTLIPFDDPADAIRMANETRYGLAATIWTKDVGRAHKTAAAVRAGSIWINGGGPPDPRVPHGGFKASGVGRELGLAGLHANTEEKVIQVAL